MPLTLGRKCHQSLIIDPQGLNIRIRAYAVDAHGRTRPDVHIRVSIETPPEMSIMREELLDRKEPT